MSQVECTVTVQCSGQVKWQSAVVWVLLSANFRKVKFSPVYKTFYLVRITKLEGYTVQKQPHNLPLTILPVGFTKQSCAFSGKAPLVYSKQSCVTHRHPQCIMVTHDTSTLHLLLFPHHNLLPHVPLLFLTTDIKILFAPKNQDNRAFTMLVFSKWLTVGRGA